VHCLYPSPLAQSPSPSTMSTMAACMGPLFLGGVPRGTVSPLGELSCPALGALTFLCCSGSVAIVVVVAVVAAAAAAAVVVGILIVGHKPHIRECVVMVTEGGGYPASMMGVAFPHCTRYLSRSVNGPRATRVASLVPVAVRRWWLLPEWAALHAWMLFRATAAARSRASSAAVALFRRRALERAVRGLRVRVAHGRRRHAAAAHHARTICRRVLARWAVALRVMRQRRQVMAGARTHGGLVTARRVLRRLAAASAQAKALRRRVSALRLSWQDRSLSTSFGEWYRVTIADRHHRLATQKAALAAWLRAHRLVTVGRVVQYRCTVSGE
jgi:hypothetical protein